MQAALRAEAALHVRVLPGGTALGTETHYVAYVNLASHVLLPLDFNAGPSLPLAFLADGALILWLDARPANPRRDVGAPRCADLIEQQAQRRGRQRRGVRGELRR